MIIGPHGASFMMIPMLMVSCLHAEMAHAVWDTQNRLGMINAAR
jgi:hypothetical protein